MQSRNGIYYTLIESPWRVTRHEITFFFSSRTHYDRFMREVDRHESRMTETMSNRIGCFIDMRLAASVQLYRQVETRGFLMKLPYQLCDKEFGKGRFREVYATCLEHLRLDGLEASVED